MTEFSTCHVIPTQKQIEKGTIAVPDHFIDELEQFREDYNAFQRDVEEWATELTDYSRLGWGEGDWWRKHSPAVHFERVRSFRRSKPVGMHMP